MDLNVEPDFDLFGSPEFEFSECGGSSSLMEQCGEEQMHLSCGVVGDDCLDEEHFVDDDESAVPSTNGVVYEDNMQLETSPNANGGVDTSVATLAVGMVYSSWEEIDVHFRSYAKQNGFGVVRTGAGYSQKDGVVTDVKRNVTWKCEQWGVHDPDKPKEISEGQVHVPDPPTKLQKSVGHKGVKLGVTKSQKCQCPVRLQVLLREVYGPYLVIT